MNERKRKRFFAVVFFLVFLSAIIGWYCLFADVWAAKKIAEEKEFAEELLEPITVDISFINKPVSLALDDIVAMANGKEGGEPWEWRFLEDPETKRGFRRAIKLPGDQGGASLEESGSLARERGIEALKPVTLEVHQVPVVEALDYLGALTGLEYFFDDRTLVVHLAEEGSFAPIVRREYFITLTGASNFGIVASSADGRIDLRGSYSLGRIGAKRFCEGWRFDYFPGKNLIVVELPETEIALLEASGSGHMMTLVQIPFWNRIWPFRRLP